MPSSTIRPIQHYHTKIPSLHNTSPQNLINTMIKQKFKNTSKVSIISKMTSKFRSKYGTPSQNQIDLTNEESQALTPTLVQMVQFKKISLIQDFLAGIQTMKLSGRLTMKIDSSPTVSGLLLSPSKVHLNGKKKDSIDQSPKTTTMAKVISTMYQSKLNKNIVLQQIVLDIQNSLELLLKDSLDQKKIFITQTLLINLSLKCPPNTPTIPSTSNKVKSSMKTLESWNGLEHSNWEILHFLPMEESSFH